MSWTRLFVLAALLSGCATPAQYVPPDTADTQSFSRELKAPYDQVWSAVTNVAGATFFDIKAFDKGSGLMTLEYSNLRGGPGPYVTCGTMTGGLTPFRTITPEANSVLNRFADRLTLSGRANITIHKASGGRTTVQVNSSYDLEAFASTDQGWALVAHWQFTSREPDTQTVNIFFNRTAVTCRPSYKIESEFLTEVGARL